MIPWYGTEFKCDWISSLLDADLLSTSETYILDPDQQFQKFHSIPAGWVGDFNMGSTRFGESI